MSGSGESFACSECGGRVEWLTGPGRTFQRLESLRAAVPDDFAIATCTACGEQFFTVERFDELARLTDRPPRWCACGWIVHDRDDGGGACALDACDGVPAPKGGAP